MPRLTLLLGIATFSAFPVHAQKQLAQSPRILNAKTVCFLNHTGSDPVGNRALAQLKKWHRFQIVAECKQSDLIFLLSADPYKGGNILLSGGQTGSIDDNGHVSEDAVPNYNKAAPARYAYLTVVDPKTAENLWSDQHVWGGLLTGFDSVGARLIAKLEKETKH